MIQESICAPAPMVWNLYIPLKGSQEDDKQRTAQLAELGLQKARMDKGVASVLIWQASDEFVVRK